MNPPPNHTPTIAAIITPHGAGAVGIVRLSGPDATRITARLFRPVSSDICPTAMQGYRGAFGHVFDNEGSFDQVVVFVYRAPKSYTGEDIAEICCHGGAYLTRRLLEACLKNGAQPAAPGEFTKRAFLNGKLDLTQAEAVMDLISAQGKAGGRAALTALDGALGKSIGELINALTTQAAQIAAWCDYPEEDLMPIDPAQLTHALQTAHTGLSGLLASYDTGRLIRQGITATIAGRPNVGKSTLMNMLCGHERCIVTDQPGTTRDLVTESISIAGVHMNLTDTAGIRESEDIAEREGVNRTLSALARADIILAVFDSTAPLQDEDHRLLERLRGLEGTPIITLLNKADLMQLTIDNGQLTMKESPAAIDLKKTTQHLALNSQPIPISAATGEGRPELERAILAALHLESIDPTAPIVANERQRLCLTAATENLTEAIAALHEGVTLDAVGVCIDAALEQLLSLTGQRVSTAVIDEVFARFCVGK